MPPSDRNGWMNRNVLATGIISLLSDASHEMVTALLPIFISLSTALGGLGGGAAALGLIEGISDGFSSLSKPVSGYLSDKTNKRKPWMVFGYITTGILLPAVAFVQNLFQLAILRISAWVGRGVRGPPRDALLSDSVEPKHYGKAFGFHRAMDSLGAIIGPVLVIVLLPMFSVRQTMLFALIPGFLSVLVVILLIKEVKKRGISREPMPTFRVSIKALPTGFRRLILAQGVFGIGNFSNTFFILAALLLLTPSLGAVAAATASVALYVALNIVYTLGSFPVGILADRHNKAALLGLGYVFNAIACLVLMLWRTDIAILGFIFIAVGLQLAFTDTAEAALAAELLPKKVTGTGFGVLQFVDGIGDLLSSSIVGILWVALSPQAGLFYSAVISIMAAVIITGLRIPKNQSPDSVH